MAKVIIFGNRDFAQLAHFYLTHDSPHQVVGFTVDQAYMPEDARFCHLPMVPFEEVATLYPPDAYSLFAPMSHRRMGKDRRRVFAAGRAMGYSFISYVSSKATTFPGTPIGTNCFILEDNTVQPFTAIGDNVIMWSGNHIGHHSQVHDHAFFTSHVVLSGHCDVQPSAFFGVNATIRDNLRLAEGTLVGMGAAITRDTDPWGVYIGNPARKTNKRSDEIDF